MTQRTFDGKKIASLCDTRCKACSRLTYTWPTGLCDGCSYRTDPLMRAWLEHALEARGKA